MSLLVTWDPPGEVLAGDESGPCPRGGLGGSHLLPGAGERIAAAQVAARVVGPRWAGPPEQRNSCPSGCPMPGVKACPVEDMFSGLERALTWWGPTGSVTHENIHLKTQAPNVQREVLFPSRPTMCALCPGGWGGRTKFTVRRPCRWPRRHLLASPPICQEAEPRGCVHVCGCM